MQASAVIVAVQTRSVHVRSSLRRVSGEANVASLEELRRRADVGRDYATRSQILMAILPERQAVKANHFGSDFLAYTGH